MEWGERGKVFMSTQKNTNRLSSHGRMRKLIKSNYSQVDTREKGERTKLVFGGHTN